MSKPGPTRYRTLNWSAYNASLRERGSLTVWFDPGMAWHAAPSGKRGRQQTFSDAAIQACLTIKVLLGLPLRQTTGFVASLLKLAELDWSVPDFSTLCRPLPGSACLHAREGPEDAGRSAALPRQRRSATPAGR